MGGPLVIGSNATDRLGAPSVYLDAKAKVAAGAISSCNTALLPGNVWAGTATKTGTNSKCSEYGDDPIQMSLQVLSSDFAGDATLQGATNYGAAAVGSAEYACTVTSQYSMVLRGYSGTYVQWRFIRSIGVLADIAAHRCRSLRGVLVDISKHSFSDFLAMSLLCLFLCMPIFHYSVVLEAQYSQDDSYAGCTNENTAQPYGYVGTLQGDTMTLSDSLQCFSLTLNRASGTSQSAPPCGSAPGPSPGPQPGGCMGGLPPSKCNLGPGKPCMFGGQCLSGNCPDSYCQ